MTLTRKSALMSVSVSVMGFTDENNFEEERRRHSLNRGLPGLIPPANSADANA
jgi:hypothetical protein